METTDPIMIRAACESLTCPGCGERLQYQELEPVTWQVRAIRRVDGKIVLDCDPDSSHGWYEASHSPALACPACPFETPLPEDFTTDWGG